MNQESIHIRKLTTGYPGKGGTKIVAKDIDATIRSGELTCLLGANGVGKSTLLRTLSAFQPPVGGEIEIMGKKRLKKSKVEAQPSVMTAAVPLSVETNEGFDRRMTVTGKITEGTIPLTSSFTITQLGLREPFIPFDSDEPFQDSTGEDFGVLKE